MNASVLLIDDDSAIRRLLRRFFERRDWMVAEGGTPQEGLDAFERERPDLVILDLELPGISGLDLLQVLTERDDSAAVIMLTGHGDISSAVTAMRNGAENFLTKPVDLDHLGAAVDRALEKVRMHRRTRYLLDRQIADSDLVSLGRSPRMQRVIEQVERVAPAGTTLLLLGETGTGKGWLANAVHGLSDRANAPFVDVNCAGLSPTLLESELFGHEKGAFTDAKERKRGLVEIAAGGTVFLDEVGELSLELQPKLLKFLENRRFRRLGGTTEITVDVRVIAATNRDLDAAVEAGEFRQDLFYRLSVMPIRLPPLRERGRGDIIDLAARRLADIHRRLRRGPARFSAETLELLAGYAWPGNIRELNNVLERAALLAADATALRPAHLPREFARATSELPIDHAAGLSLDQVERRHILRVLDQFDGNRTRAADALGISRSGLYKKLERHGIPARFPTTPRSSTS